MIKPINTRPLNITNQFSYECEKCGAKGVIKISNRMVNIENEYQMSELQEETCPICNEKLSYKKSKIKKSN